MKRGIIKIIFSKSPPNARKLPFTCRRKMKGTRVESDQLKLHSYSYQLKSKCCCIHFDFLPLLNAPLSRKFIRLIVFIGLYAQCIAAAVIVRRYVRAMKKIKKKEQKLHWLRSLQLSLHFNMKLIDNVFLCRCWDEGKIKNSE